jgi:hypothetical protein
LKIFKRDGVLIFDSKRKAAVIGTPPFSLDDAGNAAASRVFGFASDLAFPVLG